MINANKIAQEMVLQHEFLRGSQDKLGIVLAGSRAVGYEVQSSDYDFLALCDRETFEQIATLVGHSPDVIGIRLPVDRDAARRRYGVEVDIAVYDLAQVLQAFNDHRDIVIWIWTRAKILSDPTGSVDALQSTFKGYPKDVLERKLKHHFLTDFHLSVHGITYHYESQNIFSAAHALASKVAEYCRLCCLLDGKPFPYEKWLLEACKETTTGQKISPLLEKVIDHITRLNGDLVENSAYVKEAVRLLDTEACDIVEPALESWGIDKEWIENAYGLLEEVIY
jgi:predicted nucleotidyltransferase